MNHRGFATTSLLALLPVLLAGAAVCAAGFLVLRTDGEARHACRIELLRSQERIAERLKKLLEMNLGARQLRIERDIAERAVAIAVTPPAKAAALAALEAVKIRQVAYAVRQQTLILKARMESWSGPTQGARAVRKALNEAKRRQSEQLEKNNTPSLDLTTTPRPALFELTNTPKESLTPDYQPSRQFSERQTMAVRWNLRIAALLPSWLRSLVASTDITLRAQCLATLEKENDEWKPKLKLDRF